LFWLFTVALEQVALELNKQPLLVGSYQRD